MFFYIIAIVFLMDQGSKAAVQMWMYQGESIAIVKPVFYLTYILNPGAAFGFLAHQTNLLIVVTVILVLGVLLAYRSLSLERAFMRYGLGLVVGGALGNLVDRLRFGRVIDFLDFRVWPVFNLADSAIVIGVCLLILEFLKDAAKKPDQGSGS
jgi:signal peptidase II